MNSGLIVCSVVLPLSLALPKYADKLITTRDQMTYTTMLIEVNFDKELRDSLTLKGPEGQVTEQCI